jgi:hypothetical protein
MPRFYFDVYDGKTTTPDKVGLEVEDDRARIRELAVDALPDIVREKLPNGDCGEFSVTVRDAHGSNLFRATLSFRTEWIERARD